MKEMTGVVIPTCNPRIEEAVAKAKQAETSLGYTVGHSLIKQIKTITKETNYS
jgi:hypothetical protein